MPSAIPPTSSIHTQRWCIGSDIYQNYHDQEWGYPVKDDRYLFEKICLEGFQQDVTRLLNDSGIIRHRGKIEAAINNAQCALKLLETEPSLAAYFWLFEPKKMAQAMGMVNDHAKECDFRKKALDFRKQFIVPT
ncbi:hypothetical protein ACTFIZ_012874 [Dictyostelium cf. discoideum]